MVQINQVVLLAYIVASCISYSIVSTKTLSVPEPPVESSESDQLSEISTEFMNKLIASLTPEELEKLQKPLILWEPSLVDRDGNTDETPCSSLKDTEYYNFVKATDGEQYYVVTNNETKLQQVKHYACDNNGPNDNKCDPGNNDKDYGYCCRQHKATIVMYVVPLPKSQLYLANATFFRVDTKEKYENYTMIPKNVSLTSFCSCDKDKTSIKPHYTCPNPGSSLFIE